MNCDLCIVKTSTPEGRMLIKRFLTIKDAEKFYKTLDSKEIKIAYIRHFDGWHYRMVKTLKTNAEEAGITLRKKP